MSAAAEPGVGTVSVRTGTPEERLASRRRRLILGLADVVAHDGWESVTQRKVGLRGGVGPRSFHESFADLHDLSIAARTELGDDILRVAHAAAERAPRDPRAVISALVGSFEYRPSVPLFLASNAPESAGQKQQLATRLMSTIVDDRIDQPAVLIAAHGALDVTLLWLSGNLQTPSSQLIDAITGAFAAPWAT